jgi:hypothetical protein
MGSRKVFGFRKGLTEMLQGFGRCGKHSSERF